MAIDTGFFTFQGFAYPWITFPDEESVLDGTEYGALGVEFTGLLDTDTPTATQIADAILTRDVGAVEDAAAVHSLASAILKLVSRFDTGSAGEPAVTYRTDGVTEHMLQEKTTSTALVPIRSLGVGEAP